jgi:hypothetical protein
MHQLRAWSLALHCVLCYHQHKQVQAIKNEVVRLKVDGYTMASERVCGECSLCCKIIAVDVLQKPAGVWCGHCLKTSGCSIYGRRPDECRQFNCGWLVNPEFGDEWYPRRSKMVLTFDRRANRVGVHAGGRGVERPVVEESVMAAGPPINVLFRTVLASIGNHNSLV